MSIRNEVPYLVICNLMMPSILPMRIKLCQHVLDFKLIEHAVVISIVFLEHLLQILKDLLLSVLWMFMVMFMIVLLLEVALNVVNVFMIIGLVGMMYFLFVFLLPFFLGRTETAHFFIVNLSIINLRRINRFCSKRQKTHQLH